MGAFDVVGVDLELRLRIDLRRVCKQKVVARLVGRDCAGVFVYGDLTAENAATAFSDNASKPLLTSRVSGAMIDMNALKGAFADINAAMEEISRFRQDALPQMARTIVEFDELAAKGEEAVRQMEAGEQARSNLDLNLDG